MRKSLTILKDPDASSIGHSVKEFLCAINGPTWIDIKGQDTSRTRVLTTLLHGNEPSGVKALFSWLTDPDRAVPVTNISFLICSVDAALTEPEFSHRYQKNQPDINRCFRPPYDSDNGLLAKKILKRICELKPEAVIDVHNTSGSGPDFTIIPNHESNFAALAANFSKRLVITDLKLGSLMEADVGCPISTLECGGSFDMSADQTAMNAIKQFCSRENLFNGKKQQDINIYTHPLRLEIKDDVSICYAEKPDKNHDITLASDIEKHNFGLTPEEDFLGWTGPKGLDYFKAVDDEGRDIKHELFTVRDNKLFTAQTLRMFMVTPRPEIASKDCLFYLVKAD